LHGDLPDSVEKISYKPKKGRDISAGYFFSVVSVKNTLVNLMMQYFHEIHDKYIF
jgi:hypothetical protein